MVYNEHSFEFHKILNYNLINFDLYIGQCFFAYIHGSRLFSVYVCHHNHQTTTTTSSTTTTIIIIIIIIIVIDT
jgi:hypothetical protein